MCLPDLISGILLDVEGIGEVGPYLRGDIEIAREHEVGSVSYRAYTHLGHILQPGDNVLCYDVE